jgi:outer membrane protein OmpA-like peptidoglycan-associated protein
LKDLQDTRKDLVDYQETTIILKKKLEEAQKAKEIQLKAEAEHKELEKAKRQAAEMEAQKRRELEETQKKAAEMEIQRQKEYQASKLKEAERAAAREKELAEAKLKAEQFAAQRAKEETERKAGETKLAALQEKAAALEKEKNMFAGASKIPNVTVKAGEKEIAITILVINLFAPAMELKAEGKKILDNMGNFLKAYPDHKVVVRGHTDSVGKQEVNQALSEKRAQKVREYLVAYKEILPTHIEALGFGDSQPVATNKTQAGRALNRRVEIAIQTGD